MSCNDTHIIQFDFYGNRVDQDSAGLWR